MTKITRILIGLAVITIIGIIGVRSFKAYQGSSVLEKKNLLGLLILRTKIP
jgi:hypothetical protein